MLFKVQNRSNGKSTHCGVLEFSADEGMVYMPYWVSSLPQGTLVPSIGRETPHSSLYSCLGAWWVRLCAAAAICQASCNAPMPSAMTVNPARITSSRHQAKTGEDTQLCGLVHWRR